MELHTENQPHPWHYGALAIILILIVLVGSAVYLTGQSFSPKSFAAAAQAEALIAENVRHSEQMHALQEQDQADADANLVIRRQYLTWFLFGLAASMTGLVVLVALTSGAVVTTWSYRRSIEHLALATQVWREMRIQPLPVSLPNGYTALPPALDDHRLLDLRTGQITRTGDDLPASDHRTHLEQVDAVRSSVEQVSKQDPRGVSAWLPGILQKITPLPHRESKPLVFSKMSQNQNQKTKK